MHWEVTHSCGHIESHLIVADFAYVAETRARQLKRRKCTDCYRIAKAAEQAMSNEAALADIALPELTGSERQVAWAETIRRTHLAAAVRKDPDIAKRLTAHTAAKWWIDNRSQPFS